MPKKINLKLFDVDNCLYPHGPETPKFILIDDEHNRPFLDHEITQARDEGYQKIILGYGTNRQDHSTDKQNGQRKGNGSCVRVLPELQAHFKAQLPDTEVVQDTFLMADIYGNGILSAGHSYERMKAEQEQDQDQDYFFIDHAKAVFDHAKISLIYAHAHRVATAENPDDEIVIDFYDDLPDICKGITTFYSRHTDLLPSNVRLRVKKHAYDSAETITYTEIKGTGITDTSYPWSIRWMGAAGETCESPDLGEDGLAGFHRRAKYPGQLVWGNSIGTAAFPIEDFTQFRLLQSPLLPRETHLTHRGYHPAHRLQAPTKGKEIAAPVTEWRIASKKLQSATCFTSQQKIIAASVLAGVLVGVGATLLFAGVIASPLTGGSSLIASGIGLIAFKIGMTLLTSLVVATATYLVMHAVCKEKNTKPAASWNFFKATEPTPKSIRNPMDIHRPTRHNQGYKQGSVLGVRN